MRQLCYPSILAKSLFQTPAYISFGEYKTEMCGTLRDCSCQRELKISIYGLLTSGIITCGLVQLFFVFEKDSQYLILSQQIF